MASGSIKLVENRPVGAKVLERAVYYNLDERKRIVRHWHRKYNGKMNLCYIQYAPGVHKIKTEV